MLRYEDCHIYLDVTYSKSCKLALIGKASFTPAGRDVKVALGGYRRCPDSHDLSECHHLYDLGRPI